MVVLFPYRAGTPPYFDARNLCPQEANLCVRIPLFLDLSLRPLSIVLSDNVVNSTVAKQTGASSARICLLHLPVEGNFREALRSLLREFFKADLPESLEAE